VREWILHKRGSEVLTEKVENIGKIDNNATANLVGLPPLTSGKADA
jgi:hypothetical protein